MELGIHNVKKMCQDSRTKALSEIKQQRILSPLVLKNKNHTAHTYTGHPWPNYLSSAFDTPSLKKKLN